MRFTHLYFQAAILGIIVGLVATAYYKAMQFGFWLVGLVIPGAPYPTNSSAFQYVWLVTTIGGILVALIIRRLGEPSSMNQVINEINREGLIDYRKIPVMLVTSLISICCGSSVGPEAPVVDISGGLGSWMAQKLNLSTINARILTFCGMGAGLGAFFGSPVGSTFLALEFPHWMGLEYYEALIPTLISAILGFIVFRCATGLTIGGSYIFPEYGQLQHIDLLYAAVLGIIGYAVAVLINLIFKWLETQARLLSTHPIFLNALGGLLLGLIAMVLPLTLFFGEPQIQYIIDQGETIGPFMLLLIALGKILTFSISMHSGFRGGYIFALFFIGAAVGEAISLLFPSISAAVAIISLITSITCALIKTPISIILITAAISGMELIPVVSIAAVVSLLLSTNIGLLSQKRSRQL